MTELLTAAQMRAIEETAISAGDVTGQLLMERAGQGVVAAIWEEWPELAAAPGRAVVLCGPGNNGGDGFVIARLLAERGWQVAVHLFGDAAKLPPDAHRNHARWCDIGAVQSWQGFPPADGVDLAVDALFGTGLTRAVTPELVAPLETFAGRSKIVAVDIPSGLDADSGRVLGAAVPADLTVAFHRAKLGHMLAEGPALSGRLVVHDIGLTGTALGAAQEARPVALDKPAAGHKYNHGHALVLAGGAGKGGAARLAARAALRIGAGLVSVAPTPGALQENAARLDAIMLTPMGDAAALEKILADPRINALCIGPGLGLDRARDLVPVALGTPRAGTAPDTKGARSLPMVLDADALTGFSDDPTGFFRTLHADCVLTPHAGEFARLFPDLADALRAPATSGPAYSKLDATRDAAARAGCTVLLKGPDTVIADQNGRAAIHSAAYGRAAPWLATAGAGDVLAGFITGLLARGIAPFDAAQTAAWLHVACARAFGPGLIAEDLPETLPKVLASLNA